MQNGESYPQCFASTPLQIPPQTREVELISPTDQLASIFKYSDDHIYDIL